MRKDIGRVGCKHLMHTPKGICVGCGEQHQPLPGYTADELEQKEREFWRDERRD